jgi:hypothetical protein
VSVSCARFAVWTVVGLAFIPGCAVYGSASRGPPPDSSRLPFDRDTPVRSGRWSFFWGTISDVWAPIDCTSHDAEGNCTASRDPCDGRGVAQWETKLEWYSLPLGVVTLGMAVPATLTGWCSTGSPPGQGP